MARIPEDTLERVKAATDIVQVVAEHVQLRQQGRNWLGLCPFHNEKTPSFNVNPELQIYHCFGCDAGGDVFRFLQEIDKVSFLEAVTYLAERAGIELPRRGAADDDERHDRIFRANELAAKYFHYMLRQPQGAGALRYLHDRGVADATIDEFRLGYALPGWTHFLEVASRRGFPPDALEQAGLAVASRKGRGHYDRFRDRVIFPIGNLSGRTVAFGARALRADDEPKYLNSPETPVYRKSGILYGLARGREAIRRAREVLVVEGYMDLVSLVQRGVGNVVATSGTALTDAHARLLARYAERVVLLFDGDDAGGTAAARGVEVLLATDLDTRTVSLPAGHDPDSFVRRDRGPEELSQLVGSAPPALDVYLDRLAAGVDLTSVTGRARAVERLIPLFSQGTEQVRRDLMLRRVAQRFGVDEQALRRDVSAALARPRGRPEPEGQDEAAPSRRPRTAGGAPKPLTGPELERQFAGLLLQHPALIAETGRQLDLEAFVDPGVRRLMAHLVERCAVDSPLDLTALLNSVDDDLTRLVSTCAMESFDDAQVQQLWRDHIHHLRRERLTRQIDDAKQQLRRAVESGPTRGEADRLAARLRELIATRQELELAAAEVR